MDTVCMDVKSYSIKELMVFFDISINSTPDELKQSYSTKLSKIQSVEDPTQRLEIRKFIIDANETLLTLLSKSNIPIDVKINHHKFSKQLVSIDSTFRYSNSNSTTSDFVIELPKIVDKVVKMKIVSSEIPLTAYNFCAADSNNTFQIITFIDNEIIDTQVITIPDGAWYSSEFVTFINEILDNSYGTYLLMLYFGVSEYSGKSYFRIKTATEYENLGLDDEYAYNQALTYTVENISNVTFEESTLYSLGFDDVQINDISISNTTTIGLTAYTHYIESPRIFGSNFHSYYYIYINDFVGNSKDHILGIQNEGYISSNIIARIQIKNNAFTTNIDNNDDNVFKERDYYGNVRIRKLHIKLLNKFGKVVNLNSANMNLLIEFTQVYT